VKRGAAKRRKGFGLGIGCRNIERQQALLAIFRSCYRKGAQRQKPDREAVTPHIVK